MKKKLKELVWLSTFTEHFPGDPIVENYPRKVPNGFYSFAEPKFTDKFQTVVQSEYVSNLLGIEPSGLTLEEMLDLQDHLKQQHIYSWATRYTGHQFRNLVDQLGDGRAITLGEIEGSDQRVYDFQLKGAGKTPYSRIFDGKATLRSSVREFIAAEALRCLGVPTSHILGVYETNDNAIRPVKMSILGPMKAAIAIRVSESMLRFGNFEMTLWDKDHTRNWDYIEYIAERHKQVGINKESSKKDQAKQFFAFIVDSTASLVAKWQAIGFCHGVLNTDNFSALGLTIDFGPYGFLEEYNENWTPNTTDAETRLYRYGNQPMSAHWSLKSLGRALKDNIADEDFVSQTLDSFWEKYNYFHSREFSKKLGLGDDVTPVTKKAISALFTALGASYVDLTIFFRLLCGTTATDLDDTEAFLTRIKHSMYDEEETRKQAEKWTDFLSKYKEAIAEKKVIIDSNWQQEMSRINPKFIPRNWILSDMLDALEAGNTAPLQLIHKLVQHPFDEELCPVEYFQKQPKWNKHSNTFCQLSCAS